MKILNESRELYKGIFWIVDLDNLENNINYCIQIPCNSDGNIETTDIMTAKSGNTHNHEKYWNMLPGKMRHNKKFDYYPRGRVEIANGKAIVYLNPNINYEEVKDFIIKQFNLSKLNGIKSIKFICDFSNHYRCYLD